MEKALHSQYAAAIAAAPAYESAAAAAAAAAAAVPGRGCAVTHIPSAGESVMPLQASRRE